MNILGFLGGVGAGLMAGDRLIQDAKESETRRKVNELYLKRIQKGIDNNGADEDGERNSPGVSRGVTPPADALAIPPWGTSADNGANTASGNYAGVAPQAFGLTPDAPVDRRGLSIPVSRGTSRDGGYAWIPASNRYADGGYVDENDPEPRHPAEHYRDLHQAAEAQFANEVEAPMRELMMHYVSGNLNKPDVVAAIENLGLQRQHQEAHEKAVAGISGRVLHGDKQGGIDALNASRMLFPGTTVSDFVVIPAREGQPELIAAIDDKGRMLQSANGLPAVWPISWLEANLVKHAAPRRAPGPDRGGMRPSPLRSVQPPPPGVGEAHARFTMDPAMEGRRLGRPTPHGHEVLDPDGRHIGYWN